MARFEVEVTVSYVFEVEADDAPAAEDFAYMNYQEYPYNATVDGIDVEEIEEDED